MKKRYVFIEFTVFEYKVLEEYLKDMAKQGWQLVKLQYPMVFKKCEPQDIYYSVDYGSHYSANFPAETTSFQKDYRTFLREYGHTFVCSYGPIEVYYTKEKINLPIREEGNVSNEEMMRVAKKELLNRIYLPIIFCITFYFFTRAQVDFYYATKYMPLYVLYILMIVLQFATIVPYVRWMIRKKNKNKHTMKWIKTRTYIKNLSFFIWLLSFIFIFSVLVAVCVLLAVILIALYLKFYTSRIRRLKNQKMKWISGILSFLVFLYITFTLLVYVSIYFSKQPSQGTTFSTLSIVDKYETKDESIFVKAITAYGNKHDAEDGVNRITYVTVKKTPLQKFFKSRILKHWKYKRIADKKGFQIYTSGDLTMIEKDYHMVIYEKEVQINDKLLADIDQMFQTK